MTSIFDFEHQRHNTDDWAKVSYDKNRWVPMPGAFEGTPWANVAEWAFYEGEMAFLRGGRELNKKVVKKEVLPFSELLLHLYGLVVRKIPAHKLYMHCPDYTKAPVGTFIGLWKCLGTREEAFNYYSLWGTRTAVDLIGPETVPFSTELLGTGLRTQFSDVVEGRRIHSVNYVFRNQAYNTDVHVFMNTHEEQRFWEVLPELDEFVNQLYCSPDPNNNGVVIGPDEPMQS